MDTLPRSLQFTGGPRGVLLFHGLSSSPLELTFIARGLQRAGHTVCVPAMPGYTHRHGPMQDADGWTRAALQAFDDMAERCEQVAVGGLCLGAILALRVAALRADEVSALTCLSPSLDYDGWGNPWHTPLLPLARVVPFAGRIRIREREPYGLKDERLRAWVARQMAQAGESDAGAAHLRVADILQARRLIAQARAGLSDIHCPTLAVHAKEDENATPRSAFQVLSGVRSAMTRLVLLRDSFHMISIDQERETVLGEMRSFLTDAHARTTQPSPPARQSAILPFQADKAANAP